MAARIAGDRPDRYDEWLIELKKQADGRR